MTPQHAQTVLYLIAALSVLNMILSTCVAPFVDANTPVGRGLHAWLALNPLDLFKAWKTIMGGIALVLLVGVGVSACDRTGAPDPRVVTDVTVGANAAICFLGEYGKRVNTGTPKAAAIAEATVKCGLTAAQASGIFTAHRQAMVLEGYALPPDDAGSP